MTAWEQDLEFGPNRPLCRTYVLALFDMVTLQVRENSSSKGQRICWGLGWLLDGECDLLGAWMVPGENSEFLPAIFDDLTNRGVKRVCHISGPAIEPLQELASRTFASKLPRVTVDRALADAREASQEKVLMSPDCAVAEFRQRLLGAIRRHGKFDNEAATLELTQKVLQRTERLIDRRTSAVKSRLQPSRAPSHVCPDA